MIEPFRTNVRNFFAAIATAGGSTSVSATFRPAERAYLMHYCSRIAAGTLAASAVPGMAGVAIEWVHPTNAASVSAARAMKNAYGIVHPPALVSNHTGRTAIDVTIRDMIGKTIVNAAGTSVRINTLSDLHPVGASFGVIKLVSDPPHWSADGH